MNLGRIGKKCILVFSGFNQRAVIAFLRTMESHNLCYAIIAKSLEDDIFLTDYKKNVLAIRNSVPLVLEDLLSTIKEVKEKQLADEYIIAPTTEALNRFLLEHREHFEMNGCKIPLVEKDLYELVSDKYSFGNLCLEKQILIPTEIDFNKNILLPVVAKPKKYYSKCTNEILSPVIIKEPYQLKSFIKNKNVEDYYFQEFIDGRSFYLLYYFSRNGNIYKFSQENLIQQPGGKSIIAAMSSDFHYTQESEKYEKLFKSIKFFGLVMVEVRQKNDKNYMIEANPRFWGPSQLFVDAGINLFEVFLYYVGMLNQLPKCQEPSDIIRYFWFGGVVDVYKKGFELIYYQNEKNDLMNSLPTWLQSDVYRRPDTISIFKKETFC